MHTIAAQLVRILLGLYTQNAKIVCARTQKNSHKKNASHTETHPNIVASAKKWEPRSTAGKLTFSHGLLGTAVARRHKWMCNCGWLGEEGESRGARASPCTRHSRHARWPERLLPSFLPTWRLYLLQPPRGAPACHQHNRWCRLRARRLLLQTSSLLFKQNLDEHMPPRFLVDAGNHLSLSRAHSFAFYVARPSGCCFLIETHPSTCSQRVERKSLRALS